MQLFLLRVVSRLLWGMLLAFVVMHRKGSSCEGQIFLEDLDFSLHLSVRRLSEEFPPIR